MSSGHSNLCETAFIVLPLYHTKKLALHWLSYITLTNWGRSYAVAIHLPILDGMVDIWKEDMEQRSKVLAEEKTTEVKKYRNQMQSTRVAEQQERKHWTKRQQTVHSYGNQEDDLIGEDTDPVDSDETLYSLIGGESITDGDGEGHLQVLGQHVHTPAARVSHSPPRQPSWKGKERESHKCGSKSHSHVSFHDCPLNKGSWFITFHINITMYWLTKQLYNFVVTSNYYTLLCASAADQVACISCRCIYG